MAGLGGECSRGNRASLFLSISSCFQYIYCCKRLICSSDAGFGVRCDLPHIDFVGDLNPHFSNCKRSSERISVKLNRNCISSEPINLGALPRACRSKVCSFLARACVPVEQRDQGLRLSHFRMCPLSMSSLSAVHDIFTTVDGAGREQLGQSCRGHVHRASEDKQTQKARKQGLQRSTFFYLVL